MATSDGEMLTQGGLELNLSNFDRTFNLNIHMGSNRYKEALSYKIYIICMSMHGPYFVQYVNH